MSKIIKCGEYSFEVDGHKLLNPGDIPNCFICYAAGPNGDIAYVNGVALKAFPQLQAPECSKCKTGHRSGNDIECEDDDLKSALFLYKEILSLSNKTVLVNRKAKAYTVYDIESESRRRVTIEPGDCLVVLSEYEVPAQISSRYKDIMVQFIHNNEDIDNFDFVMISEETKSNDLVFKLLHFMGVR